jgi:hypothetical protein
MKATELRIGNYIFDICKRHNRVITKIDFMKLDYKIEAGATQPILLTEEWLLKFGFDKKEGKFGFEYHLNNFSLYTSENKVVCFVFDDFLVKINSVHQLQNLYFALTGLELEIN